MLKSYYEILNVESTASKNQIKNQYKKLVKIYHPDINSSFEAEEIFKEINKAAEILLDDEKRRKYDSLRVNTNKFYSQTKYSKESSNYSFSDIFNNKKKAKAKETQIKKPIKGKDITINVEIDYQEAILGTQRTVNVVHSVLCPKCLGHKFANGQKCPYCDGIGEKVLNKKITVKIPKNLKNGSKLRIKKEGQEGKYGGECGNLYVIVDIKESKEFKIENNIVYSNVFISPDMAVLGGNVPIQTLWGEAIIKIPPLTKTNQSFKLIDVGVIDEKTNKKGDQLVRVIIQIPNELSQEEKLLYEKLREASQKVRNVRSNYN